MLGYQNGQLCPGQKNADGSNVSDKKKHTLSNYCVNKKYNET
jgi:hypothetical protein